MPRACLGRSRAPSGAPSPGTGACGELNIRRHPHDNSGLTVFSLRLRAFGIWDTITRNTSKGPTPVEVVVEWNTESKFMGTPTLLGTVVRVRKVQVTASACNRGPACWGSGEEGRCEPRSEGWVGADKWGASGGMSRQRAQRGGTHKTGQVGEGGERQASGPGTPSFTESVGCLPRDHKVEGICRVFSLRRVRLKQKLCKPIRLPRKQLP